MYPQYLQMYLFFSSLNSFKALLGTTAPLLRLNNMILSRKVQGFVLACFSTLMWFLLLYWHSIVYGVYDREVCGKIWIAILCVFFFYFQFFVHCQQMCVQFVVPKILYPIWVCHAVKKHYTLIYKHNNSLFWDSRNKLG